MFLLFLLYVLCFILSFYFFEKKEGASLLLVTTYKGKRGRGAGET